MIDLCGHRVLVTGGSRGIGAACCRAFASVGATVCVHYRRAKQEAAAVLEDLAAMEGAGEGRHFSVAADLGDEKAATDLLERVETEWGSLDCLVNNAAVWVHNPLETLDAGLLEETWKLNVRAPFYLARRALPLLRRSDEASIVNISSTAGQRGEAEYSPYAASKGAIIALTKSWASELAPEIRVNSVAPGWVDTDMSENAYAEGGRERITAGIPLGRIAPPEDIAAPVVFLASPMARNITGEILNVNGGSVLCG